MHLQSHLFKQYFSALINENTLWITGGSDPDLGSLATTEFVTLDENGVGKVTPGPDLPRMQSAHCLVKMDENRYIMIGGFGSDEAVQPMIYDFSTEEWSVAPLLKTDKLRVHPHCGVVEDSATGER